MKFMLGFENVSLIQMISYDALLTAIARDIFDTK